MTSAVRMEIASLVFEERWAALATLDEGAPLASMVAYACEPGLEGILLFVSGLSLHTRNMMTDPRVSLSVARPDHGDGDPQTLPRVSLRGRVELVDRESEGFPAAWSVYVRRFPEAEPRLGLGDFVLFRLRPDEARYVGGFARAVTLTGDELREAARAR